MLFSVPENDEPPTTKREESDRSPSQRTSSVRKHNSAPGADGVGRRVSEQVGASRSLAMSSMRSDGSRKVGRDEKISMMFAEDENGNPLAPPEEAHRSCCVLM